MTSFYTELFQVVLRNSAPEIDKYIDTGSKYVSQSWPSASPPRQTTLEECSRSCIKCDSTISGTLSSATALLWDSGFALWKVSKRHTLYIAESLEWN